jgi:hypothetical protein
VHVIIRHWRGNFPLLTAILGTGLLGAGIGIAGMRLALAAAAQFDLPLALFARFELLWFLGCIAILGWAAVGIWRSASHAAARPKWVARLFLGAVGLVMVPLAMSSIQTAGELLQIAIHHDPLGPPAHLSFEGERIRIEGGLAEGSADHFNQLLASNPQLRMVELSSFGGRIAEAAQIADSIRRRNLDTFVLDECMSACTDVLLAGRRRSASAHARIGFHQATMSGYGHLDDQLATNSTRSRYIAAGIDPKFVDRAFSISSSDMWFPSDEDMLNAGLLTEVAKPSKRG